MQICGWLGWTETAKGPDITHLLVAEEEALALRREQITRLHKICCQSSQFVIYSKLAVYHTSPTNFNLPRHSLPRTSSSSSQLPGPGQTCHIRCRDSFFTMPYESSYSEACRLNPNKSSRRRWLIRCGWYTEAERRWRSPFGLMVVVVAKGRRGGQKQDQPEKVMSYISIFIVA